MPIDIQDELLKDGVKLPPLKGISETEKGYNDNSFKALKSNISAQSQITDETPLIQPLSNLVNTEGYGESRYDKEIESIDELRDLEDTRARIQPFSHKLSAGLGTFVGKTITATVGGIGSLVYGIPMAIAEGRFATLYDNDLNKWLEGINTGIDDELKVYASKSETSGGLWDQTIGSARFWTKSILGDGLSFVVGAVVFHEKNIRRKALYLFGILIGILLISMGSK